MYKNSPNITATDKEIHDVVMKTLEFLADRYPTEATVEFKHMKSKCYCEYHKTCRLVFGYEFLRTAMRGNWTTDRKYYKNWFGLNAIALVAAHEYTHAVIYDIGIYDQRESHGPDFWQYLKQMTDMLLKEFQI